MLRALSNAFTKPMKTSEHGSDHESDNESDATVEDAGGPPATQAAAKTSDVATDEKRKAVRKAPSTFRVGIRRIVKQELPADFSIGGSAMGFLEGMSEDLFRRLSTRAAALTTANGRSTVGEREATGAVRLELPPLLAKDCLAHASVALADYKKSQKPPSQPMEQDETD
jgi:histone H3/H4